MSQTDHQQLNYLTHQYLNDLLVSDRYNTHLVVNEIRARTADVPGALEEFTLVCMAHGHIDLAIALRAGKPQLLPLVSNHIHHAGTHTYRNSTNPAGLAWLLAEIPRDRIVHTNTQRRYTRADVVRLASADPAGWAFDPNEVVAWQTPLIRSQTSTWRFPYLSKSSDPVEHYDIGEREAFQRALIDAGASVHFQSSKHNLLAACIPRDAYKQPGDMLADLQRVIAWGVDIQTMGAMAWARAIKSDTDKRYTTKQGPGPAFKTLQALNIPRKSPLESSLEGSPLAMAVKLGAAGIAKRLLDEGASPLWTDPATGQTLFTVEPKLRQSTQRILTSFPVGTFNSIIDKTDVYGDTALHHAVQALDAPLVKRLLDEGANPNALNRKKQTPLHALRRDGERALAQFGQIMELLDAKQANMGADSRTSVLHNAARLLDAKSIRMLLARGDDPNATNKKGQTPLELVLTAPLRTTSSQFHPTRSQAQAEAIAALMEMGADPRQKLGNGNFPLHEAMAIGSHRVVCVLLAAGNDPHQLNDEGLTPMHMGSSRHARHWQQNKPKAQAQTRAAISEVIEAFAGAGADFKLLGPKGEVSFEKYRNIAGVAETFDRIQLEKATPHAQPGSNARRHRL